MEKSELKGITLSVDESSESDKTIALFRLADIPYVLSVTDELIYPVLRWADIQLVGFRPIAGLVGRLDPDRINKYLEIIPTEVLRMRQQRR